jgi:acetyl-CoA carboxylase / biotin carboxylase 1
MTVSRVPKTGTPVILFTFKASPSDAVEVVGGVRAVDSFEGLRRRRPQENKNIPLESDVSVIRVGAITLFDSLQHLESESFLHITELVRNETIKLKSNSLLLPNVIHVILPSNAFQNNHETSTANAIRGSLRPHTSELTNAFVRRVTCEIVSKTRGDRPLIMSFPNRLRFGEDPIVRHIEPSLAFHLQLERLSNFDIHARPVSSSSNNSSAMVHVYEAHPVKDTLAKSRFFVRALIRKMDRIGSNLNFDSFPEAETSFVEALNALEGPMAEGETKTFGSNHIFLHALPKVRVTNEYVEKIMPELYSRYKDRLRVLRVASVELRMRVTNEKGKTVAMRVIVSDPTGYSLRVETYAEVKDTVTGNMVFAALNEDARGSEMDSAFVTTPYPTRLPLERRRDLAKKMTGTVYCYDLPQLMAHALKLRWSKLNSSSFTSGVMESVELVLNKQGKLEETDRPPCKNTIGMVAWKLRLRTPEVEDEEDGFREIYLVANDITFKAGSFGVDEDALYNEVSKHARKFGLPFIYVAANSGARIGMASELKSILNVDWKQDSDPSRGFNYLWLTREDYEKHKKSVQCKPRMVNGKERMVVTAVIGKDHGIGVENLRGSGMIAGETARAYRDTFTLSYISGRCVGIGAYLVRIFFVCVCVCVFYP